jgi:hypothetical protein
MEYINSKYLIKVDRASETFKMVQQKMNGTIATHRGSEDFTSYILLNVSYNN